MDAAARGQGEAWPGCVIRFQLRTGGIIGFLAYPTNPEFPVGKLCVFY